MSKSETDDAKKIANSFLNKHDYFCGWKTGVITWTNSWSENKSSVGIQVTITDDTGYLRIYYTQTDNSSGEKKEFDYKIPLTSTPCYFGGRRYWFICPWYKNGIYCGKRVGALYKDGDYFACRHCYDLTYSSRKVNRRYRMLPLFRVFSLDDKIEKLNSQIKRRYYAGKPTRKQKRFEKLCRMADINYAQYERFKDKNLL